MKAKSAIKFLNAYQKSDRAIYFGRDTEIRELYEKVKRSRIVVLYGLSGTGKTSLVQCGLANAFSDADWMEITIRRGGHSTIMEAVAEKLKALSPNIGYIGPVLMEPLRQVYYENLKPLYLIFDQFEELFINGDKKEINRFSSFIRDILEDEELPVTVIFSLREEYFSKLDNFERKVPGIFENKFRLERMSRKTVEGVIQDIGSVSSLTISSEATNFIIDSIENKKTETVELPYLQVYLEKLFSKVAISETSLTEEHLRAVGKLDDVLSGFLEEKVTEVGQVHKIPTEEIWQVLKHMITHEGTKKTVTREALMQLAGKPSMVAAILEELVEAQIIQRQNDFYELKHDSLATKISTKRTADENSAIEAYAILKNTRAVKGRLTEEQLHRIKPQLQHLPAAAGEEMDYEELVTFLQDSENYWRWRKYLFRGLLATLFLGALVILFLIRDGLQDDYKSLIDDARLATKDRNFEQAEAFYQQALKMPWYVVKDWPTVNHELKEVETQKQVYKRGDSLFRMGEKYAAQPGGESGYEFLDSAYYYMDSAYRLRKDTLIRLRRDAIYREILFAEDDIRRRIRQFEEAGGELGTRYAASYSQVLEKLQNVKDEKN